MKKTVIGALMCIMMALPSVGLANDAHRLIDSVGVDRFAHAGISYLICDQLKRNAGFNDFWAATTTLAIGALKEISDGRWDNGDFAADAAGVLMYQIKF